MGGRHGCGVVAGGDDGAATLLATWPGQAKEGVWVWVLVHARTRAVEAHK